MSDVNNEESIHKIDLVGQYMENAMKQKPFEKAAEKILKAQGQQDVDLGKRVQAELNSRAKQSK